jgi:signal transduction histidine kinase
MDDGAGISRPDLQAILENAVTMGKSQNLSMAKAITDLLLGKLSDESQLGEGKKVTVSLPEK